MLKQILNDYLFGHVVNPVSGSENWKILNGLKVPPFRSFDEVFADKSKFELPSIHQMGKWNRRVLWNLLYYQTNYIALVVIMLLVSALVQIWDFLIGFLALTFLAATLYFSLSSNPYFVRARQDHAFFTFISITVASYCFVSSFMPVVILLTSMSLPLLLVFVHASIRLRKVRGSNNNRLERSGLKNSVMAYILARCNVEIKRL